MSAADGGVGSEGGAVIRTVVVTDLVDSTRLVSRLGDERAASLFARHDRAARDLLESHHGREIDKTDGFLLLFERPIDAVAYSLGYHRVLVELGRELGEELQARVGIHLGEVFLRENPASDVARGAKTIEAEGLAKPIAARLMAAAMGGQTLLTRTAFDVARRAAVGSPELSGELRWVAHGTYSLKGVEEAIEVFEVGFAGRSPLRAPADSEKATRVAGDRTIAGWRPAPGQEIPERPHWELRRKLGEGGFGEVWLAEHRKTRERVVFKFCFEAERLRGLKREVTLFRLLKEALGARPDIARVRDWNFDHQPYFVEVEYTAGGSLIDWAASRGGIEAVPLETRLELTAQVADALAAAHSVGVLHKDLKPGNILVSAGSDGRLQAELTDFGIGLVTDQGRLAQYGITVLGLTQATAGTGSTNSGTVQYMAPELMEGRPATVQADIYSLGVVLYQLVVGELTRSLAPGWERDVPGELLRQDIAACVDGNPERRLGTAAELSRRLRGLEERRAELEAGRAAQQATERARRRRRILAPAIAVLVVFAVTMAIQARRIAREAARANREAETARETSRFLVDLFELAEQARGRGDTVTARELLDRGSERVSRELAGEPLARARLQDTLGMVYLKLGLLAKADPLIHDALATRQRLLGTDHVDVAASLDSAGVLATRQHNDAAAERDLRRALEIKEMAFGPGHREVAETLDHLAELLKQQGRFADSRPLEQRAASIRTRLAARASSAPVATAAGRVLTVELRSQLPVPADTVGLLGVGPDGHSALLLGEGAVHVIDLEGTAPPAEIPLGEGEEVIAPVGGAVVAVHTGSRLVFRKLLSTSEGAKERTILDGLAPGEVLAVARDGSTVARLSGGVVLIYRVSPTAVTAAGEARLTGRTLRALTASRRFIGVLVDGRVHVVAVADGRELLDACDWEGKAETMAFDDWTGTLAVAGWFDEVVLYDLDHGAAPRKLRASGRTITLALLPGIPTVVAGKEGRIVVWHGSPEPVAELAAPASLWADTSWGVAGLLALDTRSHRLAVFGYRPFTAEDRGALAGVPLWSIAVAPDGSRLFLGSSDGRLHAFDLRDASLRTVTAHTQGLTSIVVLGDHLVTASDDRSLALWDAATLTNLARSKAHSSLVNGLCWDAGGDRLWSASSDWSIKAWRLPELVEEESSKPGKGSKSSLWVDSRRGLALVGTWKGSWIEVRREGSAWRVARTQEVPSDGIYCVSHHPDLDLTLILGVNPPTLWVFDPRSGGACELPVIDPATTWLTPVGRDRFAALGVNSVALYRFRREGAAIAWELSTGLSTDLGEMLIGVTIPGKERIAAGTAAGRLVLFDLNGVPSRVLAGGRLAP